MDDANHGQFRLILFKMQRKWGDCPNFATFTFH